MAQTWLQGHDTRLEDSHSNIKTQATDSLKNALNLIDDKLDNPLKISTSAAVLTVAASKVQDLKSAGTIEGTSNSISRAISPLGSTVIETASSTINVSSGAVTGDFGSSPVSPTMTASYYVYMGIELRKDGKLYTMFGTEGATSGAATKPSFSKGSLAVGYILLQDNGTGGQWHFSNPLEANIVQFSVGGSGGSGAGDAAEILERAKDWFENAPFVYMTANVFSLDESTKVDVSSTASYNVVNSSYAFGAAGQTVISKQLMDAEFITSGEDIGTIEVSAYWLLSAIDTAAVYSASRDGGSTWETITMTRIGDSDAYRGFLNFANVSSAVTDLRLKIVSSAGSKELLGYAVCYSYQQGTVSGVELRDVKTTSTNANTFTLNFLPDPTKLKVFWVEKAQVFAYGAFTLDGRSVIFPADTFNEAGTQTLIFEQPLGGGFDNSDANAALLAANKLGSSDLSIDRSAAGQGIKLRNAAGTLVELTIDTYNNIVIKSV